MRTTKIAILKVNNRISIQRQKKNAKGRFINDKLLAEYNLELHPDRNKLAILIGDMILSEAENKE